MIFYYFLTLLAVSGQVATLTEEEGLLPYNLIDLNGVEQEFEDFKSELSEFNPDILEMKSQKGDGKALVDIIGNIVLGNIWRRQRGRTKSSNFPTLVASNISEKCHKDSQDFYTAYLLRVDWAKQMFESTAQLPEAFHYSGNYHARGLFDECIAAKASWTNTEFRGQYCTVFFDSAPVMPEELEETNPAAEDQRTNWVSILQFLQWLYNGPSLKKPKVRDTDYYSKYLPSMDYCIPSSCSVEDFRSSIAQLVGSRTIDNNTYDGEIYYDSMVTVTDERYCYTQEKIDAAPNLDGPDIAVIVTLSVLGFVIILATGHELWMEYYKRPAQPKKAGLAMKSLHCFSMLTNSRKLLSTKSIAVDNLACLNGIRVLSTTWIVLYHTYYQAIINEMYNPLTFLKDATTWQLHGVLNATIAVDTFFVLSGLLVTYSLMRELDRNKGRFNIGLFYLHRYLRLTPVYAVILGFISTLLVYIGASPSWQNVRYASEGCRWNWWCNLLYLNNYVAAEPELGCMGETWYLACDMQMFLVSPLFIYLLWRWRKIGLSWAVFNIVAYIGGTIAIYIIWDLPAMGFFTRPDDTNNGYYFNGYYVATWTRAPPYILGILLGWFLHLTKKKQIKFNKLVLAACWIVASAIGLAVIYGMVPYLNPYEVPEIDEFSRVTYGSFHRIGWAAFVAWIIFACIHGYGGFVNKILSWKVFIPLSRLTYVVYLVHFTYLTVYHAYIRKPYYYTKFTHAEHYFGVVFMVFFMAFAICLTVEVPLLNLEKLLISPNRTKKPAPVDTENEVKSPTETEAISGTINTLL